MPSSVVCTTAHILVPGRCDNDMMMGVFSVRSAASMVILRDAMDSVVNGEVLSSKTFVSSD